MIEKSAVIGLVLLTGFFWFFAAGAANEAPGDSCVEFGTGLYTCSGDTFIYSRCDNPDWKTCQAFYQDAVDKSSECSNKYGIFNKDDCWALPVANPYVDYLDAELEEKFSEDSAGCAEKESSGVTDKCCSRLSAARACSAQVIASRKASEDCKAKKNYKYITQVVSPCNKCDASGPDVDPHTGFGFTCQGDAVATGVPVAQKPNCQAGYDSVRANCQSAAFACYDGCDRYGAGFYECQRACMNQDRDCIAAANEKYKDCPITSSVSGADSASPDSQPAEPPDQFKEALVAERPTAEDFAGEDEQDKKDGLREGSDEQWYFGLPYGPYVSNAQSDYTFSYRITFTRRDNNGDPEVLLPDGSKLDYTYRSLSDFRGIPPGTKIKTPPGVEVRLKFLMDEIRKPTSFGYDPYADNTFTRAVSVDIGENSELTVEEAYNGFVKIVVNDGYARFRKRKPVPLSPASPAGVMLGTKGTDFGVAYDPATKQTTAEIYDGTIEVIDLESGKVLRALSAKYGEPILSAQITADKTVAQKTAIPGSEWIAYSEQKSRSKSESESSGSGGTWTIIIIALLLGGAGFWLYEKGWLKRFLPQKNQL